MHGEFKPAAVRRVRTVVVIWLALAWGILSAGAFTASDADTLFQAHTDAFYRVHDGRGWFKESTRGGKASFWMRVEQMEMVLDAYERTHEARLLEMFTELFHGFVTDHGTNWSHNEFNDDIMWMVIACSRGYLLTGNTEFLDAAQSNFDTCFARAWSEDLGGGLWWKTDNRSKNACVNGPAAIAACLLAESNGDAAYRRKARQLFDWLKTTLFDASSGRVYDNIQRDSKLDRRCFSYNQGTFVGAANLLGDTNSAMQAATYTMNHLCRDGLLPSYGERGDGGGFNGICVRWIARFMNEHGAQSTFEPWLQQNAEAAWSIRRKSDNLSWGRWHEPTPRGRRYSWGCSSSVVILQVVRPTEIQMEEPPQ